MYCMSRMIAKAMSRRTIANVWGGAVFRHKRNLILRSHMVRGHGARIRFSLGNNVNTPFDKHESSPLSLSRTVRPRVFTDRPQNG